jgi:signal transduction histidine kinase
MPLDLKGTWERFFSTKRSTENRLMFAVLIAVIGFAATFAVHQSTSFYFSSIIMVTVILITLYSGGRLGFPLAVMLSLAADYYFIPPVGAVLNSRAGWEHFAVVVSLALVVSFAGDSLRDAYRQTILAKEEAEHAKHEAEEASALMERVLALVSHDIRNPLGTVKMASKLLEGAPAPAEKERELRAMIARNLAQVDGMIQTLLDVARIRSGKAMPLEFQPCDLAGEVRRMVEDKSLVEAPRIELDIDESIVGTFGVAGIHRALQNLVSNAIKYGAEGKPIVIALHRRGAHALLSVHNDGPAIAAEERRSIFDPFVRTRKTEESGVKGWGLGLFLVRAVAEAHEGNVAVDSAEGSGTTFTLDLPIRAT